MSMTNARKSKVPHCGRLVCAIEIIPYAMPVEAAGPLTLPGWKTHFVPTLAIGGRTCSPCRRPRGGAIRLQGVDMKRTLGGRFVPENAAGCQCTFEFPVKQNVARQRADVDRAAAIETCSCYAMLLQRASTASTGCDRHRRDAVVGKGSTRNRRRFFAALRMTRRSEWHGAQNDTALRMALADVALRGFFSRSDHPPRNRPTTRRFGWAEE